MSKLPASSLWTVGNTLASSLPLTLVTVSVMTLGPSEAYAWTAVSSVPSSQIGVSSVPSPQSIVQVTPVGLVANQVTSISVPVSTTERSASKSSMTGASVGSSSWGGIILFVNVPSWHGPQTVGTRAYSPGSRSTFSAERAGD